MKEHIPIYILMIGEDDYDNDNLLNIHRPDLFLYTHTHTNTCKIL